MELVDDVTSRDIKQLTSELEANEHVENVTYVSKEDALKRAREIFADSPEVMENIPGNPFPAAMQVEVASGASSKVLISELSNHPGVSTVDPGAVTVVECSGS